MAVHPGSSWIPLSRLGAPPDANPGHYLGPVPMWPSWMWNLPASLGGVWGLDQAMA